MDKIFSKAKWIWLAESCINQYADFVDTFIAEQGRPVRLYISADSNYAVYINGKLLYAGQYPDYPDYKVYDVFDIVSYCKSGENRIAILCMYVGEDNSTYYAAEAGLCYEIVSENKVLAYSGEHTRSRLDPCYRSGAMEKISPQLGYSYRYDSRREDGWTEKHADGFGRSVCIEKNCRWVVRPIERLRYVWEAPHILRSCGGYSLPENKGTAAEKVKNSYLRHAAPCNEVKLPSENGFTLCSDATGCYILVDMLEECAGFAYLDFELPQDAEVYIAFGEHLHDLRVRAEIGGRNFAATYIAHRGRNRWLGCMRRLGLRYLQIHFSAPQVKIYDCRIVKTEYPVEALPAKAKDRWHRQIYECGVRTLRNCMHEHYEDCPWREQALYACDSRNQMLFGYETFSGGNLQYAQANLRLISKGLRSDGLLQLCFPSRMYITIPAFSLYYILAVIENYEFAKDRQFTEDMLQTVEKITACFSGRIDDTGLLPRFTEPPYWNFYEWRDGLDGEPIMRDHEIPKRYDACLNLMYVIVIERLERLYRQLNRKLPQEYIVQVEKMKRSIRNYFYDSQRHAFVVSHDGKRADKMYAQLTQALALLAGVCEGIEKEITESLFDESLIPVTLSCKPWVYEALLREGQGYLKWIVRDIENVYGKMVLNGDTTFYETEKGADDFGLAGSLCHAWSAVACYIFNKYGEEIE